MLKLCRKYLNWIQNSVFEGEISEARLNELLIQCKQFIDPEEDSIIIFKGRGIISIDKQIIGKEKCNVDNFI